MSRRKKNCRTPNQSADVILKNIDKGYLPRDEWFSTAEVAGFILNKPIETLTAEDIGYITDALQRVERSFDDPDKAKTLAGISRHNPLRKGSPFETDLIRAWPRLKETIELPDNLPDYCHEILGTKPTAKQTVPTDEDVVDFIWNLPSAKIIHSDNENDFKNGVMAALNIIRTFQPNRTETELKLFLTIYGQFTMSCLENCCGAKVSYLCGILTGVKFFEESLSDTKEDWKFALTVELAVTAYLPKQEINRRLQSENKNKP